MRIATHIATLAALIALSFGLGRLLREPTAGGAAFLLLLAGLAGVAVRHLYRRRPSPAEPLPAPVVPEPEPEPPLWDHRVDLNTADLDDLQRLPGVGPVAAARILADREENGPFQTVEALVRVPGFGPAKVRVLAPDARTSLPAL
jgi:competence ComEA-like helix-hairpin-helix protein